MSLIADISSGNTGFADVMFLVGFILFLLAAFLFYRPPGTPPYGSMVMALGLAAVALGWLVLCPETRRSPRREAVASRRGLPLTP